MQAGPPVAECECRRHEDVEECRRHEPVHDDNRHWAVDFVPAYLPRPRREWADQGPRKSYKILLPPPARDGSARGFFRRIATALPTATARALSLAQCLLPMPTTTAWGAADVLFVRRCDLEFLGDDIGVGLKPVRLFNELATLDMPDLHPATTLVVDRRDLERWYQAPEGYRW